MASVEADVFPSETLAEKILDAAAMDNKVLEVPEEYKKVQVKQETPEPSEVAPPPPMSLAVEPLEEVYVKQEKDAMVPVKEEILQWHIDLNVPDLLSQLTHEVRHIFMD